MSKFAFLAVFLTLAAGAVAQAQDANDAKAEEFRAKLRALDWVLGPRPIDIAGNSTLSLPEGYVYLDAANTAKFEELNENLSGGKEVMIAPKSLQWGAYLIFDDDGYVKDDEKIDADAILKTLKENTEASNAERRRRGFPELHVTGWSIPPAYNATTKRLEWATLLQSQGNQATNFFTKVLGRRGVTTIVLVSAPENTTTAVADLNGVLTGYRFKQGDTYAEYRPGDKVAEYGLAGLIVGGAVAAAVKTGLLKGLWKFLVAGIAAFWKLIVAAAVAVVAGVRSLFKRKQPAP
ncbi:MAG TPA: DUF2167 domain-containing protein [Steroidobacteraceae bacterium]|nr:DUF2167 domain-containing protein [Steroidobacteraceae bacterium]